jgi:hypothetical protein
VFVTGTLSHSVEPWPVHGCCLWTLISCHWKAFALMSEGYNRAVSQISKIKFRFTPFYFTALNQTTLLPTELTVIVIWQIFLLLFSTNCYPPPEKGVPPKRIIFLWYHETRREMRTDIQQWHDTSLFTSQGIAKWKPDFQINLSPHWGWGSHRHRVKEMRGRNRLIKVWDIICFPVTQTSGLFALFMVWWFLSWRMIGVPFSM